MPLEQEILQNTVNYVFYSIFVLEMAIKIQAIGLRAYIRDRKNLFDAVILIISTVDVILQVIMDKTIES